VVVDYPKGKLIRRSSYQLLKKKKRKDTKSV
jgi:hypothetical protein